MPGKRAPVKKDKLHAMLDLVGLPRSILGIFKVMELAEDEIRAAKEKHPDEAEAIDRVFKIACPSDPLRGKTDALYIAHVRELIERARTGARYQPGTKAEVLATILDMSQKAPLTEAAQLCAELLWLEIMPHAPILDSNPATWRTWDEVASRETWTRPHRSGTPRDVLLELQRKLSSERV